MTARRTTTLLGLWTASIAMASTASATMIDIAWMSLAPADFGAAPPTFGTYNLSGIGSVQMSYTADSRFGQARVQNPALASGSIAVNADTYTWQGQETFGRTHGWSSEDLSASWEITFTFEQMAPAGSLVLGIQGLGRRNPGTDETSDECTTRVTVRNSGTYLGDWTGGSNYGPTVFSAGQDSFTLSNALSGPGEANPWWNTGLALVRIDQPLQSLTVRFSQTRGDGIGVNIGTILPEPFSSLLLAFAGGLAALSRGRRR